MIGQLLAMSGPIGMGNPSIYKPENDELLHCQQRENSGDARIFSQWGNGEREKLF